MVNVMGRNRKTVATELASQAAPLQLVFDAAIRKRLSNAVLSRQLPFRCYDEEWKELEKILRQFHQQRIVATRLPLKANVDKHLGLVAKAAEALSAILQKTTDPSQTNIALLQTGREVEYSLKASWHFEMKPQGERATYEWDLEDVAGLISCLAAAARVRKRPAGAIVDVAPKDFGFLRFVTEMDKWWRSVTGSRPTARKDENKQAHRKPSAYVEFLGALLLLLPKDLHPVVGSTPSALATAVSSARRSKSGK
jgi:hypothetical protein